MTVLAGFGVNFGKDSAEIIFSEQVIAAAIR